MRRLSTHEIAESLSRRRKAPGQSVIRKRHFRPAMEPLEIRITPTTRTWTGVEWEPLVRRTQLERQRRASWR